MARSNFPPQAYTRDTLSAAFDWLQRQPANIRELASNPDNLVALYTQSQRRSESYAPGSQINEFESQAPISSKAFKEDLKVLAEGLKRFDHSDGPSAVTGTGTINGNKATESADTLRHSSTQPTTQPANAKTTSPQPPPQGIPETDLKKTPSLPVPAKAVSLESLLDQRTRQALAEIQEQFNLSSEAEALRLVVQVGYQRLLESFPRFK